MFGYINSHCRKSYPDYSFNLVNLLDYPYRDPKRETISTKFETQCTYSGLRLSAVIYFDPYKYLLTMTMRINIFKNIFLKIILFTVWDEQQKQKTNTEMASLEARCVCFA